MALVPKDPKQKNALAIAIFSIVVLYLVNMWWHAPRLAKLEADETRLEDIERENRRAQILAARGGRDLQERMALYERHISQLELLIPGSEEVAALLNEMALRARQLDVVLDFMSPASSEPGAYYTKETFDIRAIGSYHNVGRFLTGLASLERIITPINLDLETFDDQRGLYGLESPVLASFEIQTFVIPSRSTLTETDAASPEGGSE